jgi:hypothetical protein
MKLTASFDHLSTCLRAWQSDEIGDKRTNAEGNS